MKSSVSAITFSPCSSVQQRSSRPSDTTDQLPHQNSNWCGGQRGPGGWGEGIGAQRGKVRLPCVRCLYTFSFTIWTILKLKFNDVVISLAYEKKKKWYPFFLCFYFIHAWRFVCIQSSAKYNEQLGRFWVIYITLTICTNNIFLVYWIYFTISRNIRFQEYVLEWVSVSCMWSIYYYH